MGHIGRKTAEKVFPPYFWDTGEEFLRYLEENKYIDGRLFAVRVSQFDTDKHRHRFEFYVSRMPFPKNWFFVDYTVFRTDPYFPYDFYRAFWDYYGGEYRYEPENFRAYVRACRYAMECYLIEGIRPKVSRDVRAIDAFVDKVYQEVRSTGDCELPNRGSIVYEFPDYMFVSPNLGISPGLWLAAKLLVPFYWFPSPEHLWGRFVYMPAVFNLRPGEFYLVWANFFRKLRVNLPKSIKDLYINWFVVPFYTISQPIYFDRRGVLFLGWFLDELVFEPFPQAILGKTLFIDPAYVRSLYDVYRFSYIVRHYTACYSNDKYPYPFDSIDLTRDDPVAALAFIFFMSHRMLMVDSATYRSRSVAYWGSSKELLTLEGYRPPFKELKVFAGASRFVSPTQSVKFLDRYPYLYKVGHGYSLYPEVASWFKKPD